MRIVVLDGYCLNPGDLNWESLQALGDTVVHDRTPEPEILKRAAGADVLFTNKTPLSRETLAALPDLRYIGVLATGYNIVDVAAAKERGVVVSNIPTYGTASVAQFAFALLLELCHHVGRHDDAVRAGEWFRSPDWSFWRTPQVELADKTMGIVGFGRIGKQTAGIAQAMGMKVIANDVAMSGSEPLEKLLAQSDVVSLHCPLLPDNKGMMNAERLGMMKRSAFLLNTSRGPLVVDQDLANALNNGVIAGAGLDVLSIEPPHDTNPLIGAKNCIVTPHMAWATKEARERLLGVAVENLRSFAAGKPVNVV